VFKSYKSPLLGAGAFLVLGASLCTSGPASANATVQVSNATVFVSTDEYNTSLNFYWQAIVRQPGRRVPGGPVCPAVGPR